MDMSDDKDSDETDQIDKYDEEIDTNDIKVLKLGNLVCRKIQTILRKNWMKEIQWM